ncbi:MAG TPA: hypothetical protein DIW51_16000 [Rhodospirillaceae bacterium]|nr:hypothetical protein [Rhodospirillaceae bacterium]HCS71466.1 hypothetical protein [Rhodospirillaceae bacterium]
MTVFIAGQIDERSFFENCLGFDASFFKGALKVFECLNVGRFNWNRGLKNDAFDGLNSQSNVFLDDFLPFLFLGFRKNSDRLSLRIRHFIVSGIAEEVLKRYPFAGEYLDFLYRTRLKR